MRRVLHVVLLLVVVVALVCPVSASAATYQQAYNQCMGTLNGMVAQNLPNLVFTQRCTLSGNKYTVAGSYDYTSDHSNPRIFSSSFPFDGAPPANPCTLLPSVRIYNQGKILSGSSICQRAQDPVSGGNVQCAMSFSPSSPPTQNQYSGQWETYGTLAPSGNVCGGVEGDPWKDGNGGPINPPPVVPTLPAVDVPAPPKVCGEGACYDPKSDGYCATAGGQSFCVSGATARSPAGGCVSSGDATICAGSPAAPKPPAPPASPISDPATQIKSSDRTTQADPQTGANQTVVTNVYNLPSTQTTNGQKAGDSGPAPASSTGGPQKSASGGQDCNTPPICAGDAPTCMVVSQVWLNRCKPKDDKSDVNGNGQPDWTEVQPGDGDQYATGETSAGDVFSSEVVDGSKIDQTSWAGNTCPQLAPVTVFGKTWVFGDQGLFCEWLALLRPIFLLVAGFIAIKITALGGKS